MEFLLWAHLHAILTEFFVMRYYARGKKQFLCYSSKYDYHLFIQPSSCVILPVLHSIKQFLLLHSRVFTAGRTSAWKVISTGVTQSLQLFFLPRKCLARFRNERCIANFRLHSTSSLHFFSYGYNVQQHTVEPMTQMCSRPLRRPLSTRHTLQTCPHVFRSLLYRI